jgi:trans-aconitate 2-methyltransferase
MARWGGEVLDRLPLAGDERVLDAGCGSGRVTELLATRLPRGHVIAFDASPAMLDAARERLARFGDRVSFVLGDLARPLALSRPVDAILSTATFHWVMDQEALAANLAAALRPGGRVVAQAGGAGNIENVRAAARSVGLEPAPKRFETPEAMRSRLEAAGFVEVRTWLAPEPTPLALGGPLETYLATIVLRLEIERVPEAERASMLAEIARRIPGGIVDYVRLNVDAVRL